MLDWPKGNIGWMQLIKRRRQGNKSTGGQADWNIIVEESAGDSFTVRWEPRTEGMEARAVRQATFLPEVTVGASGATTIADGELAAYSQRLAAMSPQSLPAASIDSLAELTQTAFSQVWHAAVSAWVGQELELGKTTKSSVRSPLPDGTTVPMTEAVTARGFIPCTVAEGSPACVGITILTDMSPRDATNMLAEGPRLVGGKEFTPEEKQRLQSHGVKARTFVLADPARTLPYRVVVEKSMTIVIDGAETTTTEYEEWLFHYALANSQR